MAQSDITITIEQLEALAERVGQESDQQRERLLRIIRAYVRILAVRDPDLFAPQPTIYADEDGHWDNSYPPDQEFKAHTGPAVLALRSIDFDSRATSGGFYHDLEYFTTNPGVYIDDDGHFWAGTLTGTGRFGQFAAYPGECRVECEIEYSRISDDEVPTDVLIAAEEKVRGLAFPLATEKMAAS